MKIRLELGSRSGTWAAMAAVVVAALVGAPRMDAAPFALIYTGSFNTQDALNLQSQSLPTYFTGNTPFSLVAYFDTSSPNLAPPSPPAPPPFAGFRAYSPSLALITIAGVTYSIDNFQADPVAGMTVAIFDQNSFEPGKYGIGILQQPPQDGAGFVADFDAASPNFTANAIVPTVFTGYNGVGYGSGVCLVGVPGNCTQNAVTPFVLRNNGSVFSLTLGNYVEQYAEGSPLNTAQLIATPEPNSWVLAGIGFLGLVMIAKRRTFKPQRTTANTVS